MISSDVTKELGLKGQKGMVSISQLLQQEDEEFEVAEFKLQSASGDGDVITIDSSPSKKWLRKLERDCIS